MSKPAPEPKLTEKDAMRMFAERLQGQLERARATIAKFKKDLDEHPAHAMEWSTSAFQAASMIQVYGELVRVLTAEDPNVTIKSVYATVLERMLYRAQNPSRSTSATTNLLEAERLACWAEAFGLLSAFKTTIES